jgi:hypothetical protein
VFLIIASGINLLQADLVIIAAQLFNSTVIEVEGYELPVPGRNT